MGENYANPHSVCNAAMGIWPITSYTEQLCSTLFMSSGHSFWSVVFQYPISIMG